MKNFEFDRDLFTSGEKMTVDDMRDYLKEMKEREAQLKIRLSHIDKEMESYSSAIRRASFQKGIFGEPIDDNEFFSKSDKVFYYMEHAKAMLEEQALDITMQTAQINDENRKIMNVRYAIATLSQDVRVVIKMSYLSKEEWGDDAELCEACKKAEKFEPKSTRCRKRKIALETLTDVYNRMFIKKEIKSRSVFLQTITTEISEED